MNSINDAITDALLLAATAHIWHLTTKSYAEHVAFGELYKYMHEAADKMAESSQGAGYSYTPPKGTSQTIFSPNVDDAVEAIEDYIKSLDPQNLRIQQPWLSNIIQEIQGDIYKILYKLKELG